MIKTIKRTKAKYGISIIKVNGEKFELYQNTDTEKWQLVQLNENEKELLLVSNTKKQCMQHLLKLEKLPTKE